MSIHDALRSNTLAWQAVRGARPGYDLMAGGDALATARAGEVEIAEHLYRTEATKGGITLVDVATESRVASVREMSHHVTAINAYTGRYRMSRRGVLPFAMQVTRDFGGPQVLQLLRVGPLIRVRKGADLDAATPGETALLTVLSGMTLLDLLSPTTAVAA